MFTFRNLPTHHDETADVFNETIRRQFSKYGEHEDLICMFAAQASTDSPSVDVSVITGGTASERVRENMTVFLQAVRSTSDTVKAIELENEAASCSFAAGVLGQESIYHNDAFISLLEKSEDGLCGKIHTNDDNNTPKLPACCVMETYSMHIDTVDLKNAYSRLKKNAKLARQSINNATIICSPRTYYETTSMISPRADVVFKSHQCFSDEFDWRFVTSARAPDSEAYAIIPQTTVTCYDGGVRTGIQKWTPVSYGDEQARFVRDQRFGLAISEPLTFVKIKIKQ